MTQNAADSLIVAGIGIQIQLGAEVTEKVWVNAQSGVGADGSRDLGSKSILVFWIAANSRK